MAMLVNVKGGSLLGAEILEAIEQMRQGIAILQKYNGMRAELIAVSPAKLGEHFGITNTSQAQAFNDRWESIAAGTYTELAIFLNATVEEIPTA